MPNQVAFSIVPGKTHINPQLKSGVSRNKKLEELFQQFFSPGFISDNR